MGRTLPFLSMVVLMAALISTPAITASAAQPSDPPPAFTSSAAAGRPTAAPATADLKAGLFSSLTPARLLDTRSRIGAPGPVAAGATVSFAVDGHGGVPGSGVSAVVLNLTVTAPTGAGNLTAWASGATRPNVSNLNFVRGQTIANLAFVPVGANGQVSIVNSSTGTAQIIADVAGWFRAGTASTPGAFQSVPPTRIMDTRSDKGADGPVPARGTITLNASGTPGIPTTGLSALVMNVTATAPTQPGSITVSAFGSARPPTSNLNFATGQTVPNLVVVPVGTGEKVNLYNGSAGTVQLIADVAGYFLAGTVSAPGGFRSITPNRLLDTRNGVGPVQPGDVTQVDVAGTRGVPDDGVAAAVLNITETTPSSSGYLTAWSGDGSPPTASNLNFVAGQTLPNLAVVPLLNGSAQVLNASAGTVQLIADIFGYFLAQPAMPVLLDPALPAATQYSAYSDSLTVSTDQAPVIFSTNSTLPEGLTLSSSGVLSGTPTQSGSFPIEIDLTDNLSQTSATTLTLVVRAPPRPVLIDTSMPAGEVGVGYFEPVRVAGGAAPYTWAVTAGSLPTGLALDASTGLVSGTPVATTSVSPTITVTDHAGATVAGALPLSIVAATSWAQAGHDSTQGGDNPGEASVTSSNIDRVGAEWSTSTLTATAAVGGVLYGAGTLPGTPSTSGIIAYDIATGAVLWDTPVSESGSFVSCYQLAVTSAAVICNDTSALIAISLSGNHAVLWDTTTTDPGIQPASMIVNGPLAIVFDNQALAVSAYNLSNGMRAWQRITGSGDRAMAVSGNTLYVSDESDTLRTFDLSTPTGTPGWSKPVSGVNQLVGVAGGVVTEQVSATTGAASAMKYSSAGTVAWTHTIDVGLMGLPAADPTKVYIPTGDVDDGGWEDTSVMALDLNSGAKVWQAPIDEPDRAGLVVAGGLVWAHTAEIFFGTQDSEIDTINASTGSVLHTINLPTNPGAAMIAAGGRIVIDTETATGVYGLAPPVPTISALPLHVGLTGVAYSSTLTTAGGTGSDVWSVTSGSLPAGLSLTPTGKVTGTPTAVGTTYFGVAAKDAAGRTATRSIGVSVRSLATQNWPTMGGSTDRRGLAGGETGITADGLAGFGVRWSTADIPSGNATNGSPSGTFAEEPVISDSKLFATALDGKLRAYSTTTSGTSRAPLWTASPAAGSFFYGTPSLVGTGTTGTIYQLSDQGFLYAISAASGTVSWSRDLGTAIGQTAESPLVIGTKVIINLGDHVLAVDTGGSHQISWNTPLAGQAYGFYDMSTDGTRVYGFDKCAVVALNPSTGAQVWESTINPSPNGCAGVGSYGANLATAPVVADGVVYANTASDGLAAFNANTGALIWRSVVGADTGPVVTEQYLVLGGFGGGLILVDRRTGLEVATSTADLDLSSAPTVVGDLALVQTQDQRVAAVDLTTMTKVWSSSALSGDGTILDDRPAVAAHTIYLYSSTNRVYAFGP